jgi:hypothetical protein
VAVVDESGQPVLSNVCLSARTTGDNPFAVGACDKFDGSTPNASDPDGIVLFKGLPDGSYEILPSPTPPGYRIAKNPIHATVKNADQAQATFILKSGGQTLTIVVPQDAQSGMTNVGCFAVYEADQTVTATDWHASGCVSQNTDNTVAWKLTVPTGDLVVAQTFAPPGVAPAPEQIVTVGKGEQATVTVAPVGGGVIETRLRDDGGKPIKNGCVVAIAAIAGYNGGEARAFGEPNPASCDVDDGIADGRILIHSLPVGDYSVLPVTVPRGYALPAPASATVNANKTAKVELAAVKGGARLTVSIEDPNMSALSQYCSVVFTNNDGKPGERMTQRCDWFSAQTGTIEFSGLPDGDYLLVLDPWDSIVAPPDISPVAVTITGGTGATATVTIPTSSE